jgi:ABC-type polysaccharide/polyol phosphate transport system ATPase subunit
MVDLKFDHVSKKYRIRRRLQRGQSQHPILNWLNGLRRQSEEFWALRDVSFEVRRGEALGIIGHNGAGKSTILKLLSRITTPSSGEITIRGVISGLIEVGSGFHPELTGRENIYLSGSILGMRRREITEKLDSIVEFAGVGQFIDTPVKQYSSGMYVRLGFSIAAHLEPDILLLDEVLAVGDAAFQEKCFQRIGELKEAGKTIVFVSHDLTAIERLCGRVLLISRGSVAGSGSPVEMIAQYQRDPGYGVTPRRSDGSTDAVLPRIEILSVSFHNSDGHRNPAFRTGEPMTVRIDYLAHEPVREIVFEVHIFSFYTMKERAKCQLSTDLDRAGLDLGEGRGAIECFCPELALQPGTYSVDTTIRQRNAPSDVNIAWRPGEILNVGQGKVTGGAFYMPHKWRFAQADDGADPLAGSGR